MACDVVIGKQQDREMMRRDKDRINNRMTSTCCKQSDGGLNEVIQ